LWALRAHRGTFAFLRFWFHLFIECRIEFLIIILRFGSGGGGGGGGGGGNFSISPNSKIPPFVGISELCWLLA